MSSRICMPSSMAFVTRCSFQIATQCVYLADNVGCEFHFVVLLLELVDMGGLRESISEEAHTNGLVPGVEYGEEDAAEVNDIAGVHLTRERAVNMYGHGTGYMSHWYLVGLHKLSLVC